MKRSPRIVYKNNLPKVDDPEHWSRKYSQTLLDYFWQGYEIFLKNPDNKRLLKKYKTLKNERDLERKLNEGMELAIREAMSGDQSFVVQHETYEFESAAPAPAQPPQYDIAFILLGFNRQLKWALEAKVLKENKLTNSSSYLKEINDNFLTCRYSPFSFEGAMIGYLFCDKPEEIFQSIDKYFGQKLKPHPNFHPKYLHKTSDHKRKIPVDKSHRKDVYPTEFKCHHLLLLLV